jgi:ppGpp synthetase/RelA/SpoT-type nucleotidyltranferase
MNFGEYCKDQYTKYQTFAKVVDSILGAALKTDEFHLWQIQNRAKEPSSLEKKLLDRGLLGRTDIENEIKDLAGCRLIFYSNDDVNKFLNSGIISENFDVDWDKSKPHQPVEKNPDVAELYRADHYLVSLKKDRTQLPEYAKFLNLKCEIQIQTILNHAWSETSHDVIYKPMQNIQGFGTKQHAEIKARMGKIMMQYLLPAGYEFQKVLHDFKRLSDGKALFDRDVLQAIETATDNNERFEIIVRFREHVLPNYDDIAGVFQDALQIASCTIDQARKTGLKPISTEFGDISGKSYEAVVEKALEVIEYIRYIDPKAVFSKLCNIYLSSISDKEREEVLKVIKKLSEHNFSVWKQAGSAIQTMLLQHLKGLNDDQLKEVRAIAIEVCKETLNSEVKGTSSTHNSITLHTGSVVVSDELIDTRQKAIDILKRLYINSNQENEKRNLIAAMSNAMRQPMRGQNTDELIIMVLDDTRSIYEFYHSLVKQEQFEILENLEHDALWTYRRSSQWKEGNKIGSRAKIAADKLITTIQQYRDSINKNIDFIRYKTLVGYESVFPESWTNPDFDIEGKDAYRSQKISEYVDLITSKNADDWLVFIKLCSSTNSNDLSTFSTFGQFLTLLSEKKPEIALKYIKALDENIAGFLAAFLGGLWKTAKKNEAEKIVDRWVVEGVHLNAITRHYRIEGICDEMRLKNALVAAIKSDNLNAVIELISICIEHHNETNSIALKNIFMEAIEFLTLKKVASWARAVWFKIHKSTLLDALDETQIRIVLLNLVLCPTVEHHIEEVLTAIAKKYPVEIIKYFKDRIQHYLGNPDGKSENPYLERYEEVPYEFHSLVKPLSVIPKQAVEIVRGWYKQSSELFTFRGGKLLANIFPSFPDAFQSELITLVKTKNLDDIDFVFSILRNYKGETFIHAVCKEIIIALPESDQRRINEVGIILESTGVVTGEFGMAEAYKIKKVEIEPWLKDVNRIVVIFANRYIENLNHQIASEHRRAEQGIELRKLNFGE